MTTDEALEFLRSQQPMPPTQGIDERLLRKYDDVRKYFSDYPDERCVPLFLNSFGEGDGHGIYQLVEDVIMAYPESVIVGPLLDGLRSSVGAVRYWNAQIAARLARSECVPPLASILREGDIDERLAAVTALEAIGTSDAKRRLESALDLTIEDEVKSAIQEALSVLSGAKY